MIEDGVVSTGSVAAAVSILQSGGSGSIPIFQSVDPYLSAVFATAIVVIGRFVWRNHTRSKDNKTRLNRYGRTLFGNEKDVRHRGITKQLDDLDTRLSAVEERLESIEEILDDRD